MKRMLIAFLLVLSAGISINAQESNRKEDIFREKFPYGHEIRIGYGGSPVYDQSNFLWRAWHDILLYSPYPSLNELYGVRMGREFVTGVFSAEFSIHYRRWFSLAFYAGINGMWGERYNELTQTHYNTHGVSFNIMPQARFWWFTTKDVRMYSAVGLGLYTGFYHGSSVITASAQLTPAGITFGRKLFFFAEQTISTASMGGNVGIGYRF